MRQRSIVVEGVGRVLTGREKPTLEEQFRELACLFRDQSQDEKGLKERLNDLRKNNWRYSPKMRCWLYRECLNAFRIAHLGGIEMARQRDEREDGKKPFDWSFVNVQLSEEEKIAAKLDMPDAATVWDMVVVVLKDGYKVTLSYEADSDSYCAALSGTNCGKPNEKKTLTAWGADETEALIYVLYKHVTKLNFEWEQPGVKSRRLG